MNNSMVPRCDEIIGNNVDFSVGCVIWFNDGVDDLNFGKKFLLSHSKPAVCPLQCNYISTHTLKFAWNPIVYG